MVAQSDSWGPEDVRPGQIRRDDDKGHRITVENVDGASVHGNYVPIEAPASVGFSVWNLERFRRLPLLSDPEVPLWRVSGKLPWGDAEVAAYAQVGTVIGHRSHELAREGLGPGKTWIEVVAPDAETAKRRVGALGHLVGHEIDPELLKADPAEAS